jgi:hypothetical protein
VIKGPTNHFALTSASLCVEVAECRDGDGGGGRNGAAPPVPLVLGLETPLPAPSPDFLVCKHLKQELLRKSTMPTK